MRREAKFYACPEHRMTTEGNTQIAQERARTKAARKEEQASSCSLVGICRCVSDHRNFHSLTSAASNTTQLAKENGEVRP